MASQNRPRPEFRQLRKYLENLPEGRAVTKRGFCKTLDISPDSLASIEQGRMQKGAGIARRPLMTNLTDYLVEANLLQPDHVALFIADLTERRSVLSYLPPLISINVPRIQDPILLRSIGDLKKHLSHHFRGVYVGYEDKRNDVYTALNQGFQRVVLYGLGGVGKTTMAAMIAYEHIRHRQRVLWIETGDADASAIEKKLMDSRLLLERKDFATALRDTDIKLIVLDNVWHPRIRSLLEDRIPAGIAVLITARGNIETGNRSWISLDGLDETSALELLTIASGGLDFRQNDEAKNLCRKLHHHPQAIAIAGARIDKDGEEANLPEITDNLRDYIARGDIGYEATLADLFEQNFVSPTIQKKHLRAVRAAFKGMGALFAAHAPSDLIMSLPDLDTDGKTLRFVLNTYLKDFNMVRYDREVDAYFMHDLVHTVALEKCSPRDLARGLEACQRYVQRHTTRVNFHKLYSARDNIQGAAAYALSVYGEMPENTLFYHLIRPLALNDYFEAKGYTERWLDYLEIAARMAQQQGAWRDAHYLWGKVGNGYNYFAQFDEAARAYENTLPLAAQIADADEAVCREAVSLCFVGTAKGKAGNIVLAEKLLFEDAESKAKGNANALSQIYEHQGTYIAVHRGDLSDALAYFHASLEQAEQIRSAVREERMFYTCINMGEVKHLLGEHESALEYVQSAHAHAVKTNKDDLQARALREVFEKALALGRQAEAKQAFDEAQRLYRRSDDKIGERRLHQLALRYGWPPAAPDESPAFNQLAQT